MISSGYQPPSATVATQPSVDKTAVIAVVERVLRYDIKTLDPARLDAWTELQKTLESTDFPSRLRRWVGMDLIEDKLDESGKPTDKATPRIEELADEVIAEREILAPELPWLTSGRAKNGFAFGFALGQRDGESALLAELLEAQRKTEPEHGAFLLSGYFRALRQRDETQWEAQLDLAASDPTLQRHVPELTWRSGLTDHSAKRLLSLAQEGVVTVESFRMFAFGGAVRDLPAERLSEWIECLLQSGSRTASTCAVELTSYYFVKGTASVPMPKDLVFRVLTATPLFTAARDKDRGGTEDYEWTELATRYLTEHPDKAIELGRLLLEHFREKGTIGGAFRSQTNKVLEEALRKYPGEMWAEIVARLGPPIDSRAFHIYHWLNEGALFRIPGKLLWKWIDEDTDARAWYAAHFVPKTFPGTPGSASARELLVRYGAAEKVRRNLRANFSSGAWWGPYSEHAQGKLEKLQFWKEEEADPNVLLWLDEYIETTKPSVELRDLHQRPPLPGALPGRDRGESVPARAAAQGADHAAGRPLHRRLRRPGEDHRGRADPAGDAHAPEGSAHRHLLSARCFRDELLAARP